MTFHLIKPYSQERNFGLAINTAIERMNLPEDSKDWIVLMDGDACFLTPDWGKTIQSLIQTDDYDLIGCSTNRLREPHQLVNGMFSEDTTLKKHFEQSVNMQNLYGTEIKPFNHDVAGFFMLFRYSAWQTNKFKENTPIFDRLFTRGIGKGRVGIAPGLYVLHLYRLWSDNPKNDSKHLF